MPELLLTAASLTPGAVKSTSNPPHTDGSSRVESASPGEIATGLELLVNAVAVSPYYAIIFRCVSLVICYFQKKKILDSTSTEQAVFLYIIIEAFSFFNLFFY